MDVIFNIFNKVCVLVTAASALTLVPGFRRSERSLLSVPDRGTALLVFLILGLVEKLRLDKPAGSITGSSPSARLVCWPALV
jgi:hypothetical protein